MLAKARLQTISGLALPIIGGMVSQNVMNLVDTAMVGSLGRAALAAVGLASFATFLSQAFLTGLSSGVQAMAARRKGEGNDSNAAVPLNGGLLLSLVIGLPFAVLLYLAAPTLFPYLSDDPAVVELGVPYWRTRLVAVVVVGMNFCFRGYFNGVSQSKLYMRTLLTMHITNIVVSYVLIFGKLGMPAMGSTGAALGTTIATFIGTATYVLLALRHARTAGFLRGLPEREGLGQMLRLSIPTGLQQVFFAGGLTALFWIVGKVGTLELAAANVLLNLTLVGVLPGIALGLASASLVGQALGRGDVDDARQWGYDVCKCAGVILVFIGLPMVVLPELILSAFIRGDEATVAAAVPGLRIVGATLPLDAMGMVLMNSLLGAGDSRRVAALSIGTQWLLFLPAAYLVGPVLKYGLTAIWLVQAIYRLLVAGAFLQMWRQPRWTTLRV